MKAPKGKAIKMYRDMLKIRYFEEKAIDLFNEGLIRGPMHLYIGEEAVAVGACSPLREDDYITSTHRGHGHCIAKGGDLKKMAAELLGKATGYCKGKGGSMHIADLDIGILGANGIVGGGIGIATGAGLSAKMRGTDQVSVCFFGDGASNQGVFYESLNLAAIWRLPVIYVCENNLYGLTTPATEVLAVEDVAVKAKSYDIPGEIVDGNDVLAVYEVVEKAVNRARKGGGPCLIEAKTYRVVGHYVGDPCVYRDREEVEAWKGKCPLKRMAEYLVAEKILTSQEAQAIEERVKEEVEAAARFAIASPEPEVSSLYEDLYANQVVQRSE